MTGLFFPRPAASGCSSNAPPVPLPTGYGSQTPRKVPPRNFSTANHAGARAAARVMRQPKSPFVPKKTGGKERDISTCSIEELTDMLERSARLLDTPQILAALPGGGSKIRHQQERISDRLRELEDVRDLKDELRKTHLDDEPRDPMVIEDDSTLASPPPNPELTRTKKRLMERLQPSSSNSLLNAMSLGESIELQRQDVARSREIAERRAHQLELDAQRPKAVGGILKNAMKGVPNMSGFMFHADSDEEEGEDFSLDVQEEDEDDRDALNPYRAAYQAGYNRAVLEGETGVEVVDEGEG